MKSVWSTRTSCPSWEHNRECPKDKMEHHAYHRLWFFSFLPWLIFSVMFKFIEYKPCFILQLSVLARSLVCTLPPHNTEYGKLFDPYLPVSSGFLLVSFKAAALCGQPDAPTVGRSSQWFREMVTRMLDSTSNTSDAHFPTNVFKPEVLQTQIVKPELLHQESHKTIRTSEFPNEDSSTTNIMWKILS